MKSSLRSAAKEFEALPQNIVPRILRRIEALATIPRPAGCRKLSGADNLWRIRVGDYRVVYSIDDPNAVIDIATIRHRRDVYR